MYTENHDDKYNCSYCDMFIGSKDTCEKHEHHVHQDTKKIVECRCSVCKR